MRLLLLSFSAAAIFLLSSCRESASLGIKIDSSLRSYIPADTTLLAGIDVEHLSAAPFYKRHENQIDLASLKEITQKIGVDPRRDLSSVLFALRNAMPLILAEGRFHPADVETHLQSLGATRRELGSKTIFETGGNWVFFPTEHIAVGGASQNVRLVLEGKTGEIPRSLVARLRSLPSADQMWVASREGLPLGAAPLRSDVKSALSNIAAYVSGFQAGIALDTGVHIQVDLECTSADNARQVHDALRGGLGLARLTTRDGDLALLKVYDAIQVTYREQTVHVGADLSPDVADHLVTVLAAMQKRAI
jgi:hypothetical protein